MNTEKCEQFRCSTKFDIEHNNSKQQQQQNYLEKKPKTKMNPRKQIKNK